MLSIGFQVDYQYFCNWSQIHSQCMSTSFQIKVLMDCNSVFFKDLTSNFSCVSNASPLDFEWISKMNSNEKYIRIPLGIRYGFRTTVNWISNASRVDF